MTSTPVRPPGYPSGFVFIRVIRGQNPPQPGPLKRLNHGCTRIFTDHFRYPTGSQSLDRIRVHPCNPWSKQFPTRASEKIEPRMHTDFHGSKTFQAPIRPVRPRIGPMSAKTTANEGPFPVPSAFLLAEWTKNDPDVPIPPPDRPIHRVDQWMNRANPSIPRPGKGIDSPGVMHSSTRPMHSPGPDKAFLRRTNAFHEAGKSMVRPDEWIPPPGKGIPPPDEWTHRGHGTAMSGG